MRILVTGANGQIGQEFALLSKNSRHIWLCLDRYGLDITNEAQVIKVLESFQPEVIINTAAYTKVDKAEVESNQAMMINSLGARHLAKMCQQIKAVLIHLSTDYVFSGNSDRPYSEDDDVGPLGVYGESKLAGEEAVISYCEKFIILRTSWVFGVYGNNFVKTILKLSKEKDELNIVSDQWGSPTSSRAIAETCLKISELISENTPWGIYHYSGTPYINWIGFAEEILNQAVAVNFIEKIPKLNSISSEEFLSEAKRPVNSRLSCLKLKKVFGISQDQWKLRLSDFYLN